MRALGVPKVAIELFSASSKKVAQKTVKRICFTQNHFARLVHTCDQIGFEHRIKKMEFIPRIWRRERRK